MTKASQIYNGTLLALITTNYICSISYYFKMLDLNLNNDTMRLPTRIFPLVYFLEFVFWTLISFIALNLILLKEWIQSKVITDEDRNYKTSTKYKIYLTLAPLYMYLKVPVWLGLLRKHLILNSFPYKEIAEIQRAQNVLGDINDIAATETAKQRQVCLFVHSLMFNCVNFVFIYFTANFSGSWAVDGSISVGLSIVVWYFALVEVIYSVMCRR
jgi:hypothetical protein